MVYGTSDWSLLRLTSWVWRNNLIFTPELDDIIQLIFFFPFSFRLSISASWWIRVVRGNVFHKILFSETLYLWIRDGYENNMNIKALCSVIIKSRYKVLGWKKRTTEQYTIIIKSYNWRIWSIILFYFFFEIIVLDYTRECPWKGSRLYLLMTVIDPKSETMPI